MPPYPSTPKHGSGGPGGLSGMLSPRHQTPAPGQQPPPPPRDAMLPPPLMSPVGSGGLRLPPHLAAAQALRSPSASRVRIQVNPSPGPTPPSHLLGCPLQLHEEEVNLPDTLRMWDLGFRAHKELEP